MLKKAISCGAAVSQTAVISASSSINLGVAVSLAFMVMVLTGELAA